jgi:hypothetical protein
MGASRPARRSQHAPSRTTWTAELRIGSTPIPHGRLNRAIPNTALPSGIEARTSDSTSMEKRLHCLVSQMRRSDMILLSLGIDNLIAPFENYR